MKHLTRFEMWNCRWIITKSHDSANSGIVSKKISAVAVWRGPEILAHVGRKLVARWAQTQPTFANSRTPTAARNSWSGGSARPPTCSSSSASVSLHSPSSVSSASYATRSKRWYKKFDSSGNRRHHPDPSSNLICKLLLMQPITAVSLDMPHYQSTQHLVTF